MSAFKAGALWFLITLPAVSVFGASDPCSLLTSIEIQAELKVKVTEAVPSITDVESGCLYKFGKDQLVVSYASDAAKEPKMRSIQDDPFMSGPADANRKDFGNAGCKLTNAGPQLNTTCDQYQPRWLHMAVRFHAPRPAASMDALKSLLDKAASRLR